MAEPTNPIYSSINPNVAIGPRSHAIPTYSGDKNQEDPSQQIPGMPPNYGQTALPHVITFQGIVSSVARVYRPSDEAMKDSFANARYMRNDPNIMECLEMRRRSTALLGWHIEPDDEKDPAQKWLCEEITDILRAIPRFTQLRECLMDALWYGKYAVQFRYRWKPMRGGRRVVIDRWLPVNGDKLVFRYDDGTGDFHEDQLGIRVGAGFTTGDNVAKRWQVERLNKVEPTDYGLAYFLEPWERKLLAVHKHMIEDGEYEEPRNAGRIHGVGIRSRIYWLWYQRQECLAWLMEFLERSAFGIEIWYYPWGSAKAREETRVAAEERIGQGRNIILVPKPMGEEGMSYGVERIEPGMQGAEILKDILQDYFGHAVKRYILGQTLTTEADSTGLGSNLATIHLDTYLQIVKYDATNLEETLTEELVKPLIEFNFPKFANVPIRFAIETESPDVQSKLEAWRQAYEMGCRLRESDVMDLIGAMMPEADENALENPQHTQAKQQAAMGAMGMGGQPGMGGEPGMDGPGGGDPGGADPGPFDDGGGGGSGSGPQPPEPPGPEDYDADGEAIHSRAERKKLLDPEKSAEVAEQYAKSSEFEKLHPRGEDGEFVEKGSGSGEGGKTASAKPNALLRRTGHQFDNLQKAMGLKLKKGDSATAAIRKWADKHPAGPVVASLLQVDDGGEGYDDNGFPNRGQDVFRNAIDKKFSRAELDAAAEWLEKTYSTGDLEHANQRRWLRGTVKTAAAKSEATPSDTLFDADTPNMETIDGPENTEARIAKSHKGWAVSLYDRDAAMTMNEVRIFPPDQRERAVAFAKSIIEPKGTEADKEPVDADTLFDADTPPPSDLFDKTDAPSAEFGTLARDPGKAPPPPRRGRKPMPGQQGLWDDFDEPEKPKRQEQPLLFASETARLRYHLDREFCQRGLGSPFAPADDARLVRWLSSGIGTEIEVPDRFGQVYRYSRSHGNLSVERFARKPGKGQAAFWDEDDHPRNEAGEFAEKDTKDSPESGGKAEEKEREPAPEKSANSAIDSSGDTAKIQVEGGRPPETKGTKEKGRGEKMGGAQKVGWKVEEREGVLFVTGTRYGDPNVAKLKRIGAKWDPTERAWWIPVSKRDKLEKLLGKVNEAKQEFADEAGRRKSAGLGLHIPYEASSIREYAKEFKAIWDKSDKQWLFPDEDAKSKVAARIAAWKSRQSSPSSKPKAAPAKAKTEPAPGERTLRGASGYGHRGWSEGQVVRTKDGEYLKILKASSRYVREDGLSFGVGDDSGYIYTAIARPATDEEAAPLKEKIAAEATRKAAAEQLTALREQVRANGEKPSGMHEPEGERFDDTQTLYGGGDWFVIGSEWIWHVQNNGADGDDWSRNNVRTGGAGGIGWRVPFDADLAQTIKDAAQKSRIEVPDRFGQVYRYSRSHGNLSVERFAKEQPRVPAGSPEGGQFGKKAGANSGASMSIPKNADAKPLPDDWAQRYATNSWGHAGFIGPDGTLYGLEGRHRPMLNELGAKSAPGEEGNTAEVASEYGLIRATSFHSEFAAETWGQPTLSQLEILVSKADSSPAFSFEVTDRKGEMKDWKKWREGDSRPGIGELKAFVIRALGESSTR